MTKPKPNTARQASRRAAAFYLPALMLPMPAPMDRPPRPGYAWDQYGNEVQMPMARRWLRPEEKEDEHEHD